MKWYTRVWVMLTKLKNWAESQILQKRNTDALAVANKPTGLEANADRTKYMIISLDQNAEQKSHNIKIDNSPFEKTKQLNTWEQPKRIIIIFRKKLRAG